MKQSFSLTNQTSKEATPIGILPAEIILRILEHLPDITALKIASRACRKWHELYKLNQTQLVRSCLANCVGFDVLPEATLAFRCDPSHLATCVDYFPNLKGDELAMVGEFAVSYVSNDLPVVSSTIWTLREASEMCGFHANVVCALADRFMVYCSNTPHWNISESLKQMPPSKSERQRILLGFYRFELFRRLFSAIQMNLDAALLYQLPFSLQFAPWENEQTGCIADFLGRQLAPGKTCPGFHISYGILARGRTQPNKIPQR